VRGAGQTMGAYRSLARCAGAGRTGEDKVCTCIPARAACHGPQSPALGNLKILQLQVRLELEHGLPHPFSSNVAKMAVGQNSFYHTVYSTVRASAPLIVNSPLSGLCIVFTHRSRSNRTVRAAP